MFNIKLSTSTRQTLTGKLLIVFLFGLIVIAVGVIIGLIVHRININRSEKQEKLNREFINQEDIFEESQLVSAQELYELQLLLSIDRNIVIFNRDLLLESGYKAVIEIVEKAGKKLYILKLDGKYERNKAIELGNEIRDRFPDLSGFWLNRVAQEIVEADTLKTSPEQKQESIPLPADSLKQVVDKKEKTEPEQKTKPGYYFELQVMADQKLSKIRIVRDQLEQAGYKTKIVEADVEGKTYYRLRLDRRFTLDEGRITGEKLKRELDFIHSYWLDKIRIK